MQSFSRCVWGSRSLNSIRVHILLLLLIHPSYDSMLRDSGESRLAVFIRMLISQAAAGESPAPQSPEYLKRSLNKSGLASPTVATFHERKATFTKIPNWLLVRRGRGKIYQGSLQAALRCHADQGSGRAPKASNRPGLGPEHLPP